LNDETLAVGQRLVETLPERPEAHAQLAFAQLQLGQDQAAMESWQAALQRDGQFAEAHLGVGVLLKEQGENEAAITALRKAIELAPDSDHAYRELTEVLLRVGRAEQALPIALECAQRFPEISEHHFWVGQVYLDLGDYAAAIRSHEEAIRVDPNFSLSYFPLARAYARLGQADQATRYRQRFAELKETELQADRNRNLQYDDWTTQKQRLVKRHVLAGTAQLKFGDMRLAEAHWLRAAAIDPSDLPTRKALVSLYQNQNRPGAEAQILEELIPLEPEFIEHALRLGRLLVEMHRWSAAEQVLRAAFERQPDVADVHLLLAELFLRRGEEAPAAEHAERAVQLSASSAGFLLLASIRAEQGNRSGAISALKQALSLDPNNEQLRETYEQFSRGR
jgi:tetratricopeptide (TPR) repeat protein